MEKIRNILNYKKYNAIILLTIVCLLSICYIFPGITQGHDIRFHLSRIDGIADGIKQGNWYNPIHYNYYDGYGYGNGLFYSNFFLYIPAILVAIGLNNIVAYKIFIFLITIATAFSMYIAVNKITKDSLIALFGAILYVCVPYRIIDVVTRASIGEVLSFVFIPIVFYGLYEILYGDNKKWYVFSLGIAGLILSHLISTILTCIICFITILFNFKAIIKKPKLLLKFTYSVCLCVLLVMFFIVPLLEQYSVGEFKINNENLIYNTWGSTLNITNLFGNFESMVDGKFTPAGMGYVMLALLLCRYKLSFNDERLKKICDINLIMGIVLLLSTTDLFPWQFFGEYFSVVQFPWRLLLFASYFISLAAAIILYQKFWINSLDIKKIIAILVCVLIIPLIIIFEKYEHCLPYHKMNNVGYIKSWNSYNAGGAEYLSIHAHTNVILERNKAIDNENNEYAFIKNNNKIVLEYELKNDNVEYIDVPFLYYKGYEAKTIDDIQLKVTMGKDGCTRVFVDKIDNDCKILIQYTGTKLAQGSFYISIATLVMFVIILIDIFRRKRSDISNIRNSKTTVY